MSNKNFTSSCPIPISQYPQVMLAHGGGGKLMHDLIEKMFVKTFGSKGATEGHDSAVLNIDPSKIAFTTDSYVVNPIFFPGGNIGELAINGTVNDLAMSGAVPKYLSVGFILEEGLKMDDLWKIVTSMAEAAKKAKVEIVTGDTKVVDKGKGDGIFINTAGIGEIQHDLNIHPKSVKAGDVILVNGDIARHGMAIMAVRDGLEFESSIESDCAPLSDLVRKLLVKGIDIHCLRDVTRGGMASTLNEISSQAKLTINIDESKIPVHADVASACEMFGFDPLYVANEGKMVAFIPAAQAQDALKIMRAHPEGKEAAIIGEVLKDKTSLVTLKSLIGVNRIVDMISGEQLPRIC